MEAVQPRGLNSPPDSPHKPGEVNVEEVVEENEKGQEELDGLLQKFVFASRKFDIPFEAFPW